MHVSGHGIGRYEIFRSYDLPKLPTMNPSLAIGGLGGKMETQGQVEG